MNSTATFCALLVFAIVPAVGQSQELVRQQVSRRELEQLVRELGPESADTRLGEAKRRLAEGDFREGDRVYLRVVGEAALTDTFTVRTGRVLELPDVPPIALGGVLRSELEPHLRREIGKVLRDPQVSATSFIRVAVLGGVGKQGFYLMPAELPLPQALMLAGGPVGNVKIDATTVTRGGVQVIDAVALRNLLARGASLDQANIQPGDEIRVPQPKSSGSLLAVMSVGLGLVGAVLAITR